MKVVAVLALCLTACSDRIADPDPAHDLLRASCRLYPTRARENGGSSEFACTLRVESAVSLGCVNGGTSRGWQYTSVEDFVRESAVPNRFRRTLAGTSFSSLLSSSSSTNVAYVYDVQSRLARRVRTGFNVTGPFTHDTTTFTSWDSFGRPLTASIVRPTGDEQLASISYDDTAREVVWSNGERHRMDRHGNTLQETWVFNTAFARQYDILELAEVCLP